MRKRAVLTTVVVAFIGLAAACTQVDGPVAIRTRPQPDEVCLGARVGGTLVADPSFGLALQNPGYSQGVVWPHGYSARRQGGVVVLFGGSGREVAREGDELHAAGGSAGDDAVGVYCEIVVVPGPLHDE